MRRIVTSITVAIAALAAASLAGAELIQQGNVRLKFDGELAPKKLPRHAVAPVSVQVRGSIGTADGARPPRVKRIAIAFNRFGRVSTRGLPVCDRGSLEQTTSRTARDVCGGSLVGRGTFSAIVQPPGLEKVFVDGDALAFNSSKAGKPALLIHIYVDRPVKVTVVLTFRIVRLKEGTFGTLFVADIPKIGANLGYVTNVDLTFARRYEYRGERRSFLSAKCAAPVGFPGAPFTLARGSFTFDNGQRISLGISRNCWVR